MSRRFTPRSRCLICGVKVRGERTETSAGTTCWPTNHACAAVSRERTGEGLAAREQVTGYGAPDRRCADCALWFRLNDGGEGLCRGQVPAHMALDTDGAGACPQFFPRVSA